MSERYVYAEEEGFFVDMEQTDPDNPELGTELLTGDVLELLNGLEAALANAKSGIGQNETLRDHQDSKWYHVGRAGMCEELSMRILNWAGDAYKRGDDEKAKLHRNLAEMIKENEKQERKDQAKFEKLMEEAANEQ